jgi:hypothetical protein
MQMGRSRRLMTMLSPPSWYRRSFPKYHTRPPSYRTVGSMPVRLAHPDGSKKSVDLAVNLGYTPTPYGVTAFKASG